MAFDVEMAGSYMRIRLYDTLTDADLRGLAEAVIVIEAPLTTTPSRVADLSGLTRLEVGYNGVDALAQRRRDIRVKGTSRTALVVANDMQFGVARMYQTLNDHPKITTEIFRDLESALAWVAAGTTEP
jgi:hypothetical protein